MQFYDGLVAPGETVTLSVVITDTTPRWEFYLLQKRDSPLADSTPGTAGQADAQRLRSRLLPGRRRGCKREAEVAE